MESDGHVIGSGFVGEQPVTSHKTMNLILQPHVLYCIHYCIELLYSVYVILLIIADKDYNKTKVKLRNLKKLRDF